MRHELSKIRCESPQCIEHISKYGEHYHQVYDYSTDDQYDFDARCELCGGKLIDGVWVYKCAKCGKDVGPGGLTGLFVPSVCDECENAIAEKQIKQGHVCRRCHSPYSRCCC